MKVRTNTLFLRTKAILFLGVMMFLFFLLPLHSEAVTVTVFTINSHDLAVDGTPISDGATVTPVIATAKTVTVSGTYTHPNALPGVFSAYMHRSGVSTSACVANDRNCMVGSCTITLINIVTKSYSCDFTLYPFSDSTTTPTSPVEDYSSETWTVYVQAGQKGYTGDQDNSSYFEHGSLISMYMPDSPISFGTYVPGSGPTSEYPFRIWNLGNIRFDLATQTNNNFVCGASSLDKSDLRVEDFSGTYASKTGLSTSWFGWADFDLDRQTQAGTASEKNIYWQFDTSDPIPAGACTLNGIQVSAGYG